MKKCRCSSLPLGRLCKSLKAVSEENRLKMLCFLKNGKKCVCEITEFLGMPHNLVIHHLNQMKRSGIINSQNKGRFTYYQINKKVLAKQLEVLIKTLT